MGNKFMHPFETALQKRRNYANQIMVIVESYPEYLNKERKKRDGLINEICEKLGVSERTVQRMRKVIFFMREKKMDINRTNIMDAVEFMKLEGKGVWR